MDIIKDATQNITNRLTWHTADRDQAPRCKGFAWQAGYGAFSLGQSQLVPLIRYIDSQREHHQRKTFLEELLELLHKYEIEYDEKYLWD